MSNFKQRLIVGSLATAASFFAVYYSTSPYFRIPFVLFIALIVAAALWEFYSIARRLKSEPLVNLAIGCSTAYLLVAYLSTTHPSLYVLNGLALWIILMLPYAYFLAKGNHPLANIAITLLGIAYITLPLSCLLLIDFFPFASSQDGRAWVLYLLLVSKMTDIGAYIVGKTLGNKKLAPYTSPSKTIEGAFGGLIAAIFISFCYSWLMNYYAAGTLFSLSLLQSLWLGALIGCLAQFSDLAESLLKRDGNIKDSNHLPGLGGVLDVVDSVLFVAPLVYFFIVFQFPKEVIP